MALLFCIFEMQMFALLGFYVVQTRRGNIFLTLAFPAPSNTHLTYLISSEPD
jgi:hypothetical protein